jgi:non-ribosomal peptide synthetase-like protein
MSIPRRIDKLPDPRLAFDPPLRLKIARGAVESMRIVPLVISALLIEVIVVGMITVVDYCGLVIAIFAGGVMLFAAGVATCLLATAAKWALTPNVAAGHQHPLWSSFVWRNELALTFVESLALPWMLRLLYGTPLLNMWLRTMGAEIGGGVWCETHRFPEAELVTLGNGVTINRQCVLQTHLFHDRLMRLDQVTLKDGATLGPAAIPLGLSLDPVQQLVLCLWLCEESKFLMALAGLGTQLGRG